jgi:enolase-phosphatase E1
VTEAIVTDIEGTTSSLSFVKDVLFPYAREHIDAYVRAHAGDPQVAGLLEDVRAAAGTRLDLDGVIAQLLHWIDADQKVTPLKALQGLLWEAGYRSGDFHGHVYQDALAGLRRWYARGIALYVYSSGSIYAQKLLFGHTVHGDLNALFSGYFDTTTGPKLDAESYRKIARAIGRAPEKILFLSDHHAELDAARAAGMQTVWLVRDGALDPNAAHRQARDFSEIALV